MNEGRQSNSQSGMTLVELMVALVISSIVVFFLFSIQTRMSRAYQGQSTVSEINQNLRAAKQMLVNDVRMAGYGLGDPTALGVATAVDVTHRITGLTVYNDAYADGSDSFRVLYADPTVKTLVAPAGGLDATLGRAITLGASALSVGEPALLVAESAGCLVGVTGTSAGEVLFNPGTGPYNEGPANAHCQNVLSAYNNGESVAVVRVVVRTYRIDPNRLVEGYLQMSPSGDVLPIPGDWIDMGVGFTNLQVASRFFEEGDLVDADGDGDLERDWYSGDNQLPVDPSGVRPANAVLSQFSLSIEGRSPYGTRGAAASAATPAFVDLGNVDHNALGDWGQACTNSATNPCGLDLANTPDSSRTGIYERYVGEYIYRYTSSLIDLRNMGVGR